ncbi:hypothetical protein Pst134EB_026132 [Puccinia striiformis f. sp. tritici]|nr:hypothetical protein Pst134EB_026132 [Puccinia striiformis f. sp. tritici]
MWWYPGGPRLPDDEYSKLEQGDQEEDLCFDPYTIFLDTTEKDTTKPKENEADAISDDNSIPMKSRFDW